MRFTNGIEAPHRDSCTSTYGGTDGMPPSGTAGRAALALSKRPRLGKSVSLGCLAMMLSLIGLSPTWASSTESLSGTVTANGEQSAAAPHATLQQLARPSAWKGGWLASWASLAGGQDEQQEAQQEETEELTDEERLKKYRGRLPNYYGRVVNDTQRAEIYTIQARFNEQIAKLEQQIEMLTKQRDEQVTGILTPEQLAEVKKYQEEAAQRRAARRGGGE